MKTEELLDWEGDEENLRPSPYNKISVYILKFKGEPYKITNKIGYTKAGYIKTALEKHLRSKFNNWKHLEGKGEDNLFTRFGKANEGTTLGWRENQEMLMKISKALCNKLLKDGIFTIEKIA